MANLGIEDFKNKLSGGGARPNLFQVKCIWPTAIPLRGNTADFSFLCTSASLPASTIGTVSVPFRGRNINLAGNRTFGALELSVLNDTDFGLRDAFESWMNHINNHSVNTGETNPANYQSDVTVDHLDNQGDSIKRVFFRGCFPTSVSAIALSSGASEAVEEFTVSMAIQYWESASTMNLTGGSNIGGGFPAPGAA